MKAATLSRTIKLRPISLDFSAMIDSLPIHKLNRIKAPTILSREVLIAPARSLSPPTHPAENTPSKTHQDIAQPTIPGRTHIPNTGRKISKIFFKGRKPLAGPGKMPPRQTGEGTSKLLSLISHTDTEGKLPEFRPLHNSARTLARILTPSKLPPIFFFQRTGNRRRDTETLRPGTHLEKLLQRMPP